MSQYQVFTTPEDISEKYSDVSRVVGVLPETGGQIRVSTDEFGGDLVRAIKHFIRFGDMENIPHLYTVKGNTLELITLQLENLESISPELFSEELKDRLISEDPDTIFYLPSKVVTSQDILSAVEVAERQGGFDSPPGSHEDEIPLHFDDKVLTPPVIDALKRIGVPDEAFSSKINEGLKRLIHLAGLSS